MYSTVKPDLHKLQRRSGLSLGLASTLYNITGTSISINLEENKVLII
jgi:hypothetical protein